MHLLTKEFDHLCNLLLSDNLVVMTGSGISFGANRAIDGKKMPSWTDLVLELNNQLSNPTTLGRADVEQDQIAAASILRKLFENERKDFFASIKSLVTPEVGTISPIHDLIVELNPKAIITLNFDDLHEQAYSKFDISFKKIIPYNSQGKKVIKKVLKREILEPIIIKAHGCINEVDELILDDNGFNRLLYNEPVYREFMKNILVNNNLLFLGFGFKDREFDSFLNNILSIFGSPLQNHLRISTITSSMQFETKLKRKYGVGTIPISSWTNLTTVLNDAQTNAGSKLQKLISNCLGRSLKARSKAHKELRLINESRKMFAIQILNERITQLKSNDWQHSELVYSLGSIQPNSTESIEFIRNVFLDILSNDLRSETISHVLVNLSYYMDKRHIDLLVKMRSDVLSKRLIIDQFHPEPYERDFYLFRLCNNKIKSI